MILIFGLIWLCKKIKAGEGSVLMSFRTRRWHVASRNHKPSWGKLRFARSVHQSLSQFGQKITAACWCHVMTPCQVSWFSGVFWIYENLKTKFLNLPGRATTPRCLNFIPISCMGPINSPKDTNVIFQTTLVHRSLCLYFKFELFTLNAPKLN